MYKVGVEAESMNQHPDWNNEYSILSVHQYTWREDNKITDFDVPLAGVMDSEAATLS